jgi:hypothetical protein
MVSPPISPVLATVLALRRARQAACRQCGGRAYYADVNLCEDGSSVPDLSARDEGSPNACPGCGNEPLVNVHYYGAPKADGWRKLVRTEMHWGSVTPERLREIVESVFCREPDPSELPEGRELTDDELLGPPSARDLGADDWPDPS